MKFTSTAVFAITVLTYNVATAGITCSSTECKAEAMPLLDQMDSSIQAKFGDMACVPTSSTMVMEAIFADKKDVVAGSFTEGLYQQSPYGAVIVMGTDMKTTSKNGTYVNDATATFKKIASGFQAGASGFMYQNSTRSITSANLFADMQSGNLGSILFASYVPNCSSMASGRQTCSFTRQYGHSVAVQAASASQVQIFDPTYEKWTSQLLKLADDASYSGATLSLPSHIGSDARILDKNYYTSNEVDLAEYFYGLKIAATTSSTPVVTQPSPSPTPSTPVVSQPSPSPSPSTPVVVQPSPSSTPVVTKPPKSSVWQQWATYYRTKGKFASRR